ncbi:hypothetical protein DFLDMN_006430 (plasmid) [Cupriavidus sp. H19C3]|jgi:hypothetical protein|uniref:hypothetical protein n=1 Tax=Cupriavidus sp. H19C3 TaxID=3241603 RepID=UPI003BF7B769
MTDLPVVVPQPLSLGVSSDMLNASAALCELKIGLDRHARRFVGQAYLNDWMGGPGTCAFWGDEFLEVVIPFLRWEEGRSRPFQAFVDPRFVLGASINGKPEDIAAAEVPSRIKKYAETFGSIDNVHYIWYRALGILCAHEGKHRVAFMRAHDQPAVAAWVSEAKYPEAGRITIVKPDEGEEWLAILDGRYVQVLRRPEVSSAMMRAYGVEETRWRNLGGMPDKDLVIQAVRQRGFHSQPRSSAEEDRTLDLEELARNEQSAAELVSRAVYELEPFRLDEKRYWFPVIACMAVGFLLRLFDSPKTNEPALMLLSFACGLAASMSLLRFWGPRVVTGTSRAFWRR